jgi:hypothetical protein
MNVKPPLTGNSRTVEEPPPPFPSAFAGSFSFCPRASGSIAM